MSSPLPASGSGGYDVLAHGIGGAKDLPIPTELTIAGAVAALTISFTVLVRGPISRVTPCPKRTGFARCSDTASTRARPAIYL